MLHVRAFARGLLAPEAAWPAWGVAGLLAFLYTLAYLGDPVLPGNLRLHPEGWWGWFDQSQTLASTLALAAGNLDPGKHWYPLGYALLGAPFAKAAPNHPFFLVGLASLLLAFAAFLDVARRVRVPSTLGALLFLAATLSDPILLRNWAIPWNTTPTAALTWLLLAATAATLQGTRRPYLLGLCVAGIGACRPTDLLMTLPCLAALAWSTAQASSQAEAGRGFLLGQALRLAAGGATVALPYAALHLAIYGPAPSPYMVFSQQIGFTLHDFGWKAYVLLSDPSSWFQDGVGMLRRLPWLVLGFAGLLPALFRGPVERVLAATLALHMVLYVSYVDLLPTGLWRYFNIHYFLWTLPGFALLLVLLLKDLLRPAQPRRRAIAAASLAGTALLSCVQVEPVPVGAGAPAKMVDFAGPLPPFLETYFARTVARDEAGVLVNNVNMRTLPIRGGVRMIGLRRALEGPVAWDMGTAPPTLAADAVQARYAAKASLGWPRWLRKSTWRSVLPSS